MGFLCPLRADPPLRRARPGRFGRGPIGLSFALSLTALLALLAGCGDSNSAPASSGADEAAAITSTTQGRTLVAALGDSITAGSPLWDPEEAIQQQLGGAADPQSQYEYWAQRADPSLQFRNCGVFGERTDEIAKRLDSCASGADALIIQGGINDIAQGRPVKAAAADLRKMVEAGKAIGLPVAITDVLPWNNGHPAADQPIAELNRMIATIAADEDVPLLPFHDTLEDPSVAGTMKADWTIDGDHPSVAGYKLLGERAFQLP